jgi:hypothetical protein
MYNPDNNIKKISCRPAEIVKKIACKTASIEEVLPKQSCICQEFYLVYQFTPKETATTGRYVAQFEIDFLDDSGILIVPIREILYVNILTKE